MNQQGGGEAHLDRRQAPEGQEDKAPRLGGSQGDEAERRTLEQAGIEVLVAD